MRNWLNIAVVLGLGLGTLPQAVAQSDFGPVPIESTGHIANNQCIKWSTAQKKYIAMTCGTVTGVTATSPLFSSGGTAPNLTIQVATGAQNGYLSSADWTTFNNKQSALTFGSISTSTSGVTIGSGASSTVGPAVTVNIATASGAAVGLLTAADWTTFNGKESALTFNSPLTRSVNAISCATCATVVGNCADSSGDAACGAASAGSFVIDAADTDTVVSTTAVTANSQIFVAEDSSLGTRLSVTCNTTLGRSYAVTARTAATSFTWTASAAPAANPGCYSYFIVN